MTNVRHSGSTSLTCLLIVPAGGVALVLTAIVPLALTVVGLVAAVSAVVMTVRVRHANWLTWTLIGLAAGVGCYYASAAWNVVSPLPASGGSSATAGK